MPCVTCLTCLNARDSCAKERRRCSPTSRDLQRRVLKYHIVYATSDEGSNVHDVAAYLGTDLSLVRAAVDFLEGEDYLNSTIDEDHYDYAFFPTHLQLTESGIHYSADLA